MTNLSKKELDQYESASLNIGGSVANDIYYMAEKGQSEYDRVIHTTIDMDDGSVMYLQTRYVATKEKWNKVGFPVHVTRKEAEAVWADYLARKDSK